MIDSQERTKDNLSVLYLNNKKIQGAKNDETAIQAFELFADFLDSFKLANTKEIFGSEANYSENKQVKEKLKQTFKDNSKCLALQLLQQKKGIPNRSKTVADNKQEKKHNEPKVTTGIVPQNKQDNYKSQMNDLVEKSNKLDRLMEERSKMEMEKASSQVSNHHERKPAKVVMQENKNEMRDSGPDPNQLFGNIHLKSKINGKEKNSEGKKGNRDEQIESHSNLSSSKKSPKLNDTGELLVSESMGYDVSVQSEALEEFDYVESIEND